jgi:hypothetical protein
MGTYRLPHQPSAADVDHDGVPVRVSIGKLDTEIRRLPARDRRARVLAALCVHDQLAPDSWNPLDGNFVWNKQWRARRMLRNPAAKAIYEQTMAEQAMADFRSTVRGRYR